jgi:hypothetical protein
MENKQATVDIGYEDFHALMLEKYVKLFEVMQGIPPMMTDVFSKLHDKPLHTVCHHLAKMVANSVNAVLVLGMNGLGNDALKITRSMFEAAVTVKYLRLHPEEFDDYFDFHFIVAMKRHKYMEKHDPAALSRVPLEVIASNLAGYDRVKSRYLRDPNKPNKVRGYWSKKGFPEICAEVGLEGHYLTFYDLTSRIIHADISGVLAQGDREPGVLDVEIAPSELNVEMALRTAHAYLVLAVSEYIVLARPDKRAIADRLDADFMTVWKKS